MCLTVRVCQVSSSHVGNARGNLSEFRSLQGPSSAAHVATFSTAQENPPPHQSPLVGQTEVQMVAQHAHPRNLGVPRLIVPRPGVPQVVDNADLNLLDQTAGQTAHRR